MTSHFEKIAIEYSPSQRCLHVESLAEMLMDNRRALTNGTKTDFWVVAIEDDSDSAAKVCRQIYENFPDRFGERSKSQTGRRAPHAPHNGSQAPTDTRGRGCRVVRSPSLAGG